MRDTATQHNASALPNWEATSFGAVADFINGYAFKPSDWSKFGLPIIRIAQMLNADTATDHYEGELPNAYRIDDGDLLFSWSATLATVMWTRGPAWLNQHLFKVVPKTGNSTRFLHHLIDFHIESLAAQSHGTTMRHIKRGDLLSYPVLRPNPIEQSRIAAVLDTVDEAIAKTEAMIAKLKQVRAGLLHDLLTYGLDEHGQLRDPIAHPEQFQASLLGQIPKEWGVAPLGSFIDSAEYGISSSLDSQGELPVLRMNNLSGGEAVLDDLKFATTAVPESLLLRYGDVLFNRTNSYEHVGRTGIWRGQMPRATFASYLVRLNPIPSRIVSEFLNLLLNMPDSQQRMRRFATPAVQQVNINPTNLQRMLVSIPKQVTEQEAIVRIVDASAYSMGSEEQLLTKLKSLKAGLMTDLLTGRVRVSEGSIVTL